MSRVVLSRFVIKITLLVFLGVVSMKNLDFSSFLTKIDRTSLLGFFVVQPIVLVNMVIVSYRFSLFVSSPPPKLWITMKAIILSSGLGMIVPARGAELLKATYMRQNLSVPLHRGFSAVVVERGVDAILIFLLASSAYLASFVSVWSFFPIFLAGAFGAIFILRSLPALTWDLPSWIPFRKVIKEILADIVRQKESGVLAKGVVWGVVAWFVYFVAVVTLFRVISFHPIYMPTIIEAFVIGTVGLLIPLFPGGLATFEAAVIYVLTRHGYTFEEALTISLVWHAATLALPCIGSLFILMTERTGLCLAVEEIRKSVSVSRSGKVEVKENV